MSSLKKAPTVEEFHTALTSDPVNEELIVDTLSKLPSRDRLEFRKNYKDSYYHPIQNDINEFLSSKFRDLCLVLFDSPAELDAKELHRSLHSFINDYNTICEIVGSRCKRELDLIADAYYKFYNVKLEDDFQNETPKELAEFIKITMETERPKEPKLSDEETKEVANSIDQRGVYNLTKDVEFFKSVLLDNSRDDLVNICRAYNHMKDKDLYQAIRDETSGKNKKLIKAILFSLISPSEYFSKKVYKAIRGLGTDNNSLNRIIAQRSEIDIDVMNEYYKAKREKTLIEDVADDCKGAYKDLMEKLCSKKPSEK